MSLENGEQAIARAKTILKALEIPGPYRLAGLHKRRPEGFDSGGWTVQLDTKPRRYAVVFRPNGRVWYVNRPGDVGGQIENPKDLKAATRVARLLQKFGPAFPVRPLHKDDETSMFFFVGLVKGLPVVYPRTALGYRFIMKNGEFHEFSADEKAPEVPSAKPRLKENDALKAVDRIFKELYPPKDGYTFSYNLYDKRELGWYLPEEGGGAVRLVWRVPYMFRSHHQFGSRGGSNGMLIDALTGEQVKTKYVP